MIQFTNYTGTAPGTTTMEVPGLDGLGTCPPGYYGQAIMLPGSSVPVTTDQAGQSVVVNPYGTESRLMGCNTPANSLNGLGASNIRWGLVALAFGLGFAGFLAYSHAKHK